MTKSGTGTVTLSGTSTYSGATSVTAGTLNITGALNGSSSTTVTDATLEGTGRMTGPVTIGNGLNSAGSAIIEPGAAGVVGTLTASSSVSLLSDAQFVFNLNSTGGGGGSGSSELIAASVNLNSSAEFSFFDISSNPGALTMGDIFPVISTSSGALTGTFANLPNGAVFASNGNVYQAEYNSTELTLTVIPEPATWGMIISGFGMLIGIQKLRKRSMGI